MNYTSTNQNDDFARIAKAEDQGKTGTDMLELFAEELPTQHDLRPPYYTVGTLSTYGSTASSVSSISTV